MADSFNNATSKFLGWLGTHGAVVSPKVKITDLRSGHQGRGIVATEDIEDDMLLFSIPRTLLISRDSCSLVQDFPDAKSVLHSLDSWEALILALMYETRVKQSGSDWYAYLQMLPTADEENYTLDLLMFWSDSELDKLKPSLILGRVGKEEAQELYAKLLDIIEREPCLELLKAVSRDDFHKIATVIMSYSFDVPPADVDQSDDDVDADDDDEIDEDDRFKAMVPLADTMNADTNLHNAQLFYGEHDLVMRSIKPIKQGQQIFNTFSDHPNSEILRRYGYVEYQGSKFDFGEIPLETIKDYFASHNYIDLQLFDEVTQTLQEITELDDGREDFENIVLESYDCFVSKEVIIEFIVLIQVLSAISIIHSTQPFEKQSKDDRTDLVARIYTKTLQMIEAMTLTAKFKENYVKILERRMQEYPSEASTDFDVCPSPSRDTMAKVVLKSEYRSLRNCLETDRALRINNIPFKFVDDTRLINKIMKRKVHDLSSGPTKKKKK